MKAQQWLLLSLAFTTLSMALPIDNVGDVALDSRDAKDPLLGRSPAFSDNIAKREAADGLEKKGEFARPASPAKIEKREASDGLEKKAKSARPASPDKIE
ncbi:hypothetical protein MMC28_002063 [Mycoblastus sanguinarius]|nr:hypothetical protein [Mycoblastus sanguinarius]